MAINKEKDPMEALEEQFREHDLDAQSQFAGSSVRMADSFRKLSDTENGYQLRRIAVIVLGICIPLALTAAAYWMKTAFTPQTVEISKEFVGDFPLKAEINSTFNDLPGGPPRLRVSAKALGSEDWVTVFESIATEPEMLDEAYAEFVTPLIAFALYDTLFAVTTNGGYSWRTSVIYNPQDSTAMVIDGVILDESGSGFLFPPGVKSFDSCWTSEDFGLNWFSPSP